MDLIYGGLVKKYNICFTRRIQRSVTVIPYQPLKIMYKWKPKNKKAQKLWEKRIKESKEDFSLEWGKDMWKEYGGLELEDYFIDSRKIVYMTDGMHVTKNGVILHDIDANLLDF